MTRRHRTLRGRIPLIRDGGLTPAKEHPEKIACHDPCCLCRHNGVFDEPRGDIEEDSGSRAPREQA